MAVTQYQPIAVVVDDNSLSSYTYVELFAGGAGLAIALLLNRKVKSIVINDLDYCVYAFWYSVLYQTDDLCALITDTEVTVRQWKIQKEVFTNYSEHSALEVGFATLFLNRTNRSGILKGGIIGGKGQTGTYAIDCRFNKQDIIERIRNIAAMRDGITLFNMDAGEFLRTQNTVLRKRCFFYLDPPYVAKGGDLYKNAFQIDDHRFLSEVVGEILHGRKWIITYDNDPLIEMLYRDYPMQTYQLSYTAQDKKRGAERMIFSKKLRIPQRTIIQKARR